MSAEELNKWLDLNMEPWQLEMMQYFIDNPKAKYELTTRRRG